MRARLSFVTVKRSGTRVVRDVRLEVDRIRIGRGTQSEVELEELSVALEHASIEVRTGQPWIAVVHGEDLRVNAQLTTARPLAPGDAIRIGDHELRLLEPGPDEDVSLEIEKVVHPVDEGAALAIRTRMGIGEGIFSQRRAAWLAAFLVAGVALAWPLFVERGAEKFDPEGPERGRTSSMPLSAFLSSGRISPVHAHFGDRCNACHLDAFAAVPDKACRGCHAGVGAHTDTDSAGSEESPMVVKHRGLLAEVACAECHREHRGAAALAASPQALCANCHADATAALSTNDSQPSPAGSASSPASPTILRATDFAADHPEFRPAVLLEAGSAVRTRVSLADHPREQSGLKFQHSKHLVAGLKAPDGAVTLHCPDCHQPDARGTTMKTIVFEEKCERCHSLAFDTGYPERYALHGDPASLTEDLFEFYATRALRGEALDEAAPEIARRRPGRDLTEPERATVLRWVGEKTSRVARFLLGEEGVCANCHVLDRKGEDVKVQPVRLVPFEGADRWMPRALFRHDKHVAAGCESCHDARRSDAATTVLLPGIERCRECHGGGGPQAGKITSPCTECHDFHRARFGPMRAAGGSAS